MQAAGAYAEVVEPSGDWRGYSAVAVDITNPGDSELSLTFRIFDVDHRMNYRDRLNLPIAIPGRSRATVRVTAPANSTSPACGWSKPRTQRFPVDFPIEFSKGVRFAGCARYAARILHNLQT